MTFSILASFSTAATTSLRVTRRTDAQRWDIERQHDLAVSPAVPFGGFLLAEPSAFDAAAFRLATTEAAQMDPQQRLLLECAAEAIRGCAGRSSPHCRCAECARSGHMLSVFKKFRVGLRLSLHFQLCGQCAADR